MRLIGHLNALGAWRERLEEYAPEGAPASSDLVAYVRDTYSFQTVPVPPFQSALVFNQGKCVIESKTFGVGLLVMEPNGDVVQTTTTEQAESFLGDLTSRLDKEFGYRLSGSIRRKSYVSNIVVEFAAGFDEQFGKVSQICRLVAPLFPGGSEVRLKKLAIGTPTLLASTDQVMQVEDVEFLIERRAGDDFAANRYYCSAPIHTAEHVRLLEKIETAVLEN